MSHQNGQARVAPAAPPIIASTSPPLPLVKAAGAILDLPPCLTAAGNLADRIAVAIADAEAQQERLMAEATSWEKRVHLLRALAEYAGDPQTEAVLAALLPPPPAPLKPALPPPPPERISECVQVTADLVFVATQTFNEDFTINDVLNLMTDGKALDELERKRTRQAICDAFMRLLNTDRVVKASQGVGRQQSTWRKAALPAVLGNHGR